MAKNKVTERTFKKDCKIINLAIEYRGYTGDILYAVITDLTEDELNKKYGEELSAYRPFVILSRAMGFAIREQQRNEEKYKKRHARGEVDYEAMLDILFVDDEQTENARKAAEVSSRNRTKEISRKALMSLTPLQRKYIVRYYLDGLTLEEIARETGKHRNTIWGICERGRQRYIKAVAAMEVA